MNAIIALCHFCDLHGPSPIFCTQTLRDTKVKDYINAKDSASSGIHQTPRNCNDCTTVGRRQILVSHDPNSSASFLSTQSPIFGEAVQLVKHAAMRSLSNEESYKQNGGFVFFGDAMRAHVLSHTFELHDSQARGFSKLFSIVVLMKDKMFLLNIQPFLADCLVNISKELQQLAKTIYDTEQAKCSERALRIQTGQTSTKASRSLVELTGDPHIFGVLHSHFAWILLAGTRCLTETNLNLMPLLARKMKLNSVESPVDECDDDEEHEETLTLRNMKIILNSSFLPLCFCAITGCQIVLRGRENLTKPIAKGLRVLLPEQMFYKVCKLNLQRYEAEPHIVTTKLEILVPEPSANIFRVDFVKQNDFSVKWLGSVPEKLPDLLIKVMKALEEKLFDENVLLKHITVLIEEWKNKVLCMQKIRSNSELTKIKKILGVQPQDQPLVNYWTKFL